MAVILGNIAVLLDVASPWAVILDRKARPMSNDGVSNINLPKRESHTYNAFIAATKGFDLDGGEAKKERVVVRGKANSKVNGVDFDSDEEGNDNGNGYSGEEDEDFDWEKEMRRRVKEIEERKELVKKAEELQSQMQDGEGEAEGDDREESEEEKRMRVRKELEKVSQYLLL